MIYISEQLFRVAHRCSNPECRVPTSAPSSNGKVNTIGVAAHICAASPGGPRYDKNMTADQRKAIDNGIWLCSNCSIDIDKDEQRYTVSYLKKWKETAESYARSELGKKLPNTNDTINTITQALGGFPKSYISTAISNIHNVSSCALESLDDRFHVKTSYENEQTTINISAKERVSLKLKIDSKNTREYFEKYKNLIEHGEDIKINSRAITIEGSKLFDEIFSNTDGTFEILNKKIKAIQKIWLVQRKTNIIDSFNEVHGEISIGSKSFTFKGHSCNNLLTFQFKKSIEGYTQNSNLTISPNFEKWDGIKLKNLFYFDKLFSFFQKISTDWSLFTSLEIDGEEIVRSNEIITCDWNFAIETSSYLNFIHNCRIISNRFNFSIDYLSNSSYTTQECDLIAGIAATIEGKTNYKKSDFKNNATTEFTLDDKSQGIELLKNTKKPISLKFIQSVGDVIVLFGVTCTLPTKSIFLDNVIPKIKKLKNKSPNENRVKIELLAQDDFIYREEYTI